MPKTRNLAEISAKLLSRKLVPLEDRVFATLFVIGMAMYGLGMALFFAIDGGRAELRIRNELAELTARTWVQENRGRLQSPSLDDQSSPASAKTVTSTNQYALIDKRRFPQFDFLKVNHYLVKSDGSEPVVLIHAPRELGAHLLLAVPAAHVPMLARPSHRYRVQAEILGIVILVQLLLARYLLRRSVFGGLNSIARALFQRKVFFATGGVAFDGFGQRIDGHVHLLNSFMRRIRSLTDTFRPGAREARPSARRVTIERLPEAPRLSLEGFSNDEIGHIALAVEESFLRHERNERLLAEIFETLPQAVLVLEANGTLFHANRAFLDLFRRRESALRDASEGFEDVLVSGLGLAPDLARRAQKVLEQAAPRLYRYDVDIGSGREFRRVAVSVSTMGIHGRRLAVFVFEEPYGAPSARLEENVSDIALRQLKSLQRLSFLLESSTSERTTELRRECELLIDQVNTLFDVPSFGAQARNSRQSLEFNLISFFRNLPERIPSKIPVDLVLRKDVPSYIIGDPTHLRQALKAVCDAFLEANHDAPARLLVKSDLDANEIVVSVEHAEQMPTKRHPPLEGFLRRILPFLSFSCRSLEGQPGHVFALFSFPYVRANSKPAPLTLDLNERLATRHLVCLPFPDTTGPSPDEQLAQTLGAGQVTFLRTLSETFSRLDATVHALVVFASQTGWVQDEGLNRLLKAAVALHIPAVVVPENPRRGDSVAAMAAGFQAYLPKPCSREELEGILMFLTQTSPGGRSSRQGLLTRHTLREIFQNLGRALVASFEPSDAESAEALATHLSRMGYKVTHTLSPNQFFEELYRSEYDVVFFAGTASSGLRRRITLATRGRRCIGFSNTPANSTDVLRSRDGNGLLWVNNCDDSSEILKAIRQVNEDESSGADPSSHVA